MNRTGRRLGRFVVALALLACPVWSHAGPVERDPDWRSLGTGLEHRVMEGGHACRKGSPKITVVRFDPERWKLDLFHYKETPGASEPLDIQQWKQRTGAAVVFNAGQYYPDYRHMGLFVKEGRNLGSRQHTSWKGLLVAEPAGSRTPRAAIIDLDHDRFDLESSPYTRILQSFMLLDRAGKKRVRRSDWHANRTVVAADRRGKILVLHTEGAYTLWELAEWIARSNLDVTQALSMDGGFEAQMCVTMGGLDYLSYGQWHVDDRGDHSLAGYRARLPAAVGLFPRR